jgi:hypothetical protein
MPKQRYKGREPTHEWSQIRLLLEDPTQIQYEILRPIVLFWVSPQERAAETGVSKSLLYSKLGSQFMSSFQRPSFPCPVQV